MAHQAGIKTVVVGTGDQTGVTTGRLTITGRETTTRLVTIGRATITGLVILGRATITGLVTKGRAIAAGVAKETTGRATEKVGWVMIGRATANRLDTTTGRATVTGTAGTNAGRVTTGTNAVRRPNRPRRTGITPIVGATGAPTMTWA